MTDTTVQTTGDVANAERFVTSHGQRFRYVAATRRWLVYRDGVWRDDPDRIAARAAAEQVARGLLTEAAAETDPDRRKALTDEARRLQSDRRLQAMLDVAEPHLAVTVDQLDADPWLLNVRNGVVDLRTAELLDHDPKMLLTRQADASYQPDTYGAGWAAFLETILPDESVRTFVQRLVGAAVVGTQRDHVLPILFGTGANGKSTLLGALDRTLGDYAGKVAVTVLTGATEDRTGATPELVALRGRRLVVADEPEAGARLREAMIKRLTGGDRIVARGLYSDPIEFTPAHTLLLVTNHRPQVLGTDDGIWRRLLLVPFSETVPPHRQDPDLPAKLAAEADAVLTWTVNGCLAYQQRGLAPPAEVRAATDAYRAESDHLAGFLEDACLLSDTVKTPGGQLYDAYTEWCRQAGYEPVNATTFGTQLTDKGYPSTKIRGRMVRRGIALKSDREEAA